MYDNAHDQIDELANPTVPRPSATRVMASGLALDLCNGWPLPPDPTPKRLSELKSKRVIDVVLAAAALVFLAVPLLLTSLAIKLTSAGPVLFAQERVGLGGKKFRLLKFRSVRQEATDHSGLAQVTAQDDRLTPIGGWLRASSVDELPQLWNILIGEMSIVGPRPMVPGMQAAGRDYHDVVPYYDYRFTMLPGLSGWAQANGLRGPTSEPASAIARIEHDCAYIQNFSIALDVKIIVKTITSQFLTGSGV